MERHRDAVLRLVGIAAMLVWSAVLVGFCVSGRIEAYIRPESLRFACLLGGLGLGLLSLFNLWHIREESGCGECGCGHQAKEPGGEMPDTHACCGQGCASADPGASGDDGQEEEWDRSYAGNLAMFLVMVVPLLVAAAYSKDRYLSANTIYNKGFVEDAAAVARSVEQRWGRGIPGPEVDDKRDSRKYTLTDLQQLVERSPEGNFLFTVDQLFYTSGDGELQRILEGQPVEVVGQVIPYDDAEHSHPTRLRVFALMITCCAADAQPVSIPVEFTGPLPGFEPMTWVKVVGAMRYPREGGRVVPLLRVKSMTPAEAPYDDSR